tara:strand:+ start:374 stop:826 length:453 start_codon:yes stop_codon:yes gene_type:complete
MITKSAKEKVGRVLYRDQVYKMLESANEGSTLYIKENSRQLFKLTEDNSFFNLTRDKKVGVKVFTWWDAKRVEVLDNLVKTGAEVFILDKYNKEHVTVLDNPRQLWYERCHPKRSFVASNCVYTDDPYDTAWEQVMAHLSHLEFNSQKLK